MKFQLLFLTLVLSEACKPNQYERLLQATVTRRSLDSALILPDSARLTLAQARTLIDLQTRAHHGLLCWPSETTTVGGLLRGIQTCTPAANPATQSDSVWRGVQRVIRAHLDDTTHVVFPSVDDIVIWREDARRWRVFGYVEANDWSGRERIIPFIAVMGSYLDGSGYFPHELEIGTARERQMVGALRDIDSLVRLLRP